MTTTTYGLLSTYPPTHVGWPSSHRRAANASLRARARPEDFGVVRRVDAREPGSPSEVVHELLRPSSGKARAAAVLKPFRPSPSSSNEYGIFRRADCEEGPPLLDDLTCPRSVVLHRSS